MSGAPEILQCKILDNTLLKHYPAGTLHLPAAKAAAMAQQGRVALPKGVKLPAGVAPAKPVDDGTYLQRTRFASRPRDLIRVLYIQDNSKLGGAELSNLHVAAVGAQCGFDILGMTPARCDLSLLEACDLAVVNNFFEFPPQVTRNLMRKLIESGVPYVKYEHDYRELKRTTFAQVLYQHAAGVVFLSPRHRDMMLARFKDERLKEKSKAFALAIDVDAYSARGMDRPAGSVLIPTWRKCKDNAARYINEHPDRSYTLVGKLERRFNAKKVKAVKNVEPAGMVDLYNTHETMLHLPDNEWAGERVFFEALLCGCKVVVNEHVGHASWSGELEYDSISAPGVDDLRVAPYEFWRFVERTCLR